MDVSTLFKFTNDRNDGLEVFFTIGRISAFKENFGFITPINPEAEDIFFPADALDGPDFYQNDLVLVEFYEAKHTNEIVSESGQAFKFGDEVVDRTDGIDPQVGDLVSFVTVGDNSAGWVQVLGYGTISSFGSGKTGDFCYIDWKARKSNVYYHIGKNDSLKQAVAKGSSIYFTPYLYRRNGETLIQGRDMYVLTTGTVKTVNSSSSGTITLGQNRMLQFRGEDVVRGSIGAGDMVRLQIGPPDHEQNTFPIYSIWPIKQGKVTGEGTITSDSLVYAFIPTDVVGLSNLEIDDRVQFCVDGDTAISVSLAGTINGTVASLAGVTLSTQTPVTCSVTLHGSKKRTLTLELTCRTKLAFKANAPISVELTRDWVQNTLRGIAAPGRAIATQQQEKPVSAQPVVSPAAPVPGKAPAVNTAPKAQPETASKAAKVTSSNSSAKPVSVATPAAPAQPARPATVPQVASKETIVSSASSSGSILHLSELDVYTDQVLGRGTSSVYRGRFYGRDPKGEEVAVKEISDPADESELNTLVHLARQPNYSSQLVSYYACKQHGTKTFLVLELMPHTLRSWLDENPNLPEAERIDIINQVVNAVHFLHENQFIHRDIKPENILMTADGHVKLADFGLSRRASALNTRSYLASTQVRGIYAAPEAADSKFAYVSDVWSLGCVICLIWSGWHPFERPNEDNLLEDVQKRIKKDDKPGLRALEEDKSNIVICDLIAWMTQYQKDFRPTMAALRKHPFFWRPIEDTWPFLQSLMPLLSNTPDNESFDKKLLAMVQEKDSVVYSTIKKQKWISVLEEKEKAFIDFVQYQHLKVTNSHYAPRFEQLVRCMFNCFKHYKEWPEPQKTQFAPDNDPSAIFRRCFPTLLLTLWKCCQQRREQLQANINRYAFVALE